MVTGLHISMYYSQISKSQEVKLIAHKKQKYEFLIFYK